MRVPIELPSLLSHALIHLCILEKSFKWKKLVSIVLLWPRTNEFKNKANNSMSMFQLIHNGE
jgi:hypothetical protein